MTTKNKILWVLALAGLVVTSYLWKRGADERAAADAASSAMGNTGGAARTNSSNAGPDLTSASTNSQNNTNAGGSADALALALAAIAKENNPGLQSAALLKLVESLRLTDVPAALTATANQSARVPSEFRQMLVRRWAKSDGPGAADWIEKNLSKNRLPNIGTAKKLIHALKHYAGLTVHARSIGNKAIGEMNSVALRARWPIGCGLIPAATNAKI